LKPPDANLLCGWAKKTGRVLTVEENVLQGGFGSAVLELFQERGLLSTKSDAWVFLIASSNTDHSSAEREIWNRREWNF